MTDIIRAYINLAFGLEGHRPGFIDGYFGPEAWKHTDKQPLAELELEANALADAVERLEPPERGLFLSPQVQAMQTSIHLLKGERLPYAEEVHGLYDVEPQRAPESEFEEAIAALGELLPGEGEIAEREQALRAKLVVPKEKIKDVSGVIVAELRKRTAAKFPLPEGEAFDVELVRDKPWSGYNWYLGNYRSRIDINTDLPTHLPNLPNLIAHEVYPGHHTEHSLKEQRLWQEAGRLEHSILLLNAPECVISEGIATWALEMVIDEGELRDWLADELAPLVGCKGEDVTTMLKVNKAKEVLHGVMGNAALNLYEDGADEAEVLNYIERYGLEAPERARKTLQFITDPISRSYVFTYSAGYDLLKPLLSGSDADAWFSRLLQEPVTPGIIREWVAKASPAMRL